MRLVLFGATGRTGRIVRQLALERGHEVTCFVRSPNKIECRSSRLRIIQGDVTDTDAVADAVADHEASIITLGSNGLRDNSTLCVGTKNAVDGMARQGVGRLVVLSAAGVGKSWKQIPLLSRLLFRTLLRNIYSDHEAQEERVSKSSLDWTIVRAGILNDEPASGNVIASNTAKIGKISRADLAEFLVEQVMDGTYSRQVISVSS